MALKGGRELLFSNLIIQSKYYLAWEWHGCLGWSKICGKHSSSENKALFFLDKAVTSPQLAESGLCCSLSSAAAARRSLPLWSVYSLGPSWMIFPLPRHSSPLYSTAYWRMGRIKKVQLENKPRSSGKLIQQEYVNEYNCFPRLKVKVKLSQHSKQNTI